jgi:predicted DNA binding CopG/RHH family protein
METENFTEKEIFDDNLAMRISKFDLDAFKKKAGKPYQMMIREIIKAFNEDRVRIIPTTEQKESLKIYQD